MQYTDPPISVSDQITNLTHQGLIIFDNIRATRYLKFVGFHRLMKYAVPYRTNWTTNNFLWGTTFDNILDLYIFDRKLRLLILDATERIEVAFRSVISNEMSLSKGAHWYLDETNFERGDNSEIIRNIADATNFFSKKKQDGACKHYYTKYTYPPLPTSWIVTETLTFGKWSKVYSDINDGALKTKIANEFGLTTNIFKSWLQSLAITRNYCAHHRRVWNRNHIVKIPKIPNFLRAEIPESTCKTTYSRLAMLQFVLKKIINSNRFSENLSSLLRECPIPYHSPMGFPSYWETMPLWN